MPKNRKGYTFRDRQGNWYARVTVTDVSGKRRNVKRRVKDRADGKQLLKTLVRQLEEEGEHAVEFANKTVHDLCDLYETVYLHEAQYVHGRKVSGLRAVDRAERVLKLFREYFGS